MYNFGLVQYIGAPLYVSYASSLHLLPVEKLQADLGTPSYVVALYGFKMSLLLSYLRFIPGTFRIVSQVVIVLCTMAHIAFLCIFLLTCVPVQMMWDSTVTEGKCIDGVAFYMSFSSITIIFDVVM